MSQNQPEPSSGLGLKIGAAVAVVLVAVVYLAWPAAEPPPAEQPPPTRAGLPETRPNSPFQGQQAPGSGAAAELESGEEIDAVAKLRATPMQRQFGKPQMGGGHGQDAPAEPADLDDDDLEDIPTLRQMALHDPDPERRLTAVTLLGVSENKEAITILAQALSDQDEDVRMEAVLALADFSDEAPVEALEIALSDPSADVRYEALDVLSDIETPEAYRAMKGALDDPDEDVRELAEILIELYNDEDYAH